jgi:hypothetical protein
MKLIIKDQKLKIPKMKNLSKKNLLKLKMAQIFFKLKIKIQLKNKK